MIFKVYTIFFNSVAKEQNVFEGGKLSNIFLIKKAIQSSDSFLVYLMSSLISKLIS